LLFSVSGIAKPYEMLAIMGSSGSGKTTMLNVLNFRNRGSLKIQGEIKINGESVETVEQISSVSGYVQQDDLFIGTLVYFERFIMKIFYLN
jgi:ABC-type multidrug transport system ATPase subunit